MTRQEEVMMNVKVLFLLRGELVLEYGPFRSVRIQSGELDVLRTDAVHPEEWFSLSAQMTNYFTWLLPGALMADEVRIEPQDNSHHS